MRQRPLTPADLELVHDHKPPKPFLIRKPGTTRAMRRFETRAGAKLWGRWRAAQDGGRLVVVKQEKGALVVKLDAGEVWERARRFLNDGKP